jgi:hypothetical protein
MGASIGLTSATPNPGFPVKLRLDGSFTLGQTETVNYIIGEAYVNDPSQATTATAIINTGTLTWYAEFINPNPAAGTYNTRGKIIYTIQGQEGTQTAYSNVIGGVQVN